MDVQSIVGDVKSRTDLVVTRGQEVLETGYETLKAVNSIVVDGVQTLVQTQVAAGKELIDLAQASFTKAKADGFKAVAANPIAYLPEGKTTVVGAYTESLTAVTKTGDQLAKTVKGGYSNISSVIVGKPTVKAKAAKTTKAAKKTVRKAAKKVAKAAA